MRTFIIGLVLIIALLGIRAAMVVLPATGLLQTYEPTGLERCEALTIAPGTEDLTVHPETGLVYVSAAQRRDGDRAGNGIWRFDPANPEATLEKISPALDGLTPHGISLLLRDSAPDRLFVISHPPGNGHTVEIFEISETGGLDHVETVTYPALSSPNDILAVGPRQFYASNDRRFASGPMATLEAFLGLPLSSVSYFDGEAGSIVAEGLAYANGINIAPDGRTVYVAEVLGRRVNVYRRDGRSGALERRGRIPVGTGADNIEIGTDGALYIGGHRDIFAFLNHAEDESVIAPSEIIRVDPQTGETDRIFYSDGAEISASSVGVVADERLFVGAVFDDHVLICPAP